MRNLPPPPASSQSLRPDRRVTLIIPPDLASAINADLSVGWTPTKIIVTALRRAYRIKSPKAPTLDKKAT